MSSLMVPNRRFPGFFVCWWFGWTCFPEQPEARALYIDTVLIKDVSFVFVAEII